MTNKLNLVPFGQSRRISLRILSTLDPRSKKVTSSTDLQHKSIYSEESNITTAKSIVIFDVSNPPISVLCIHLIKPY